MNITTRISYNVGCNPDGIENYLKHLYHYYNFPILTKPLDFPVPGRVKKKQKNLNT
jgi:hypothetical protein